MTRSPAQVLSRSVWQIALTWLKAWDEAASMTYDDIQDRRIEALRKELVDLKSTVSTSRAATELNPDLAIKEAGMTADTNKAVVNAFIDTCWRRGEINRLDEFWTADCVNHADPAVQKTGLAALGSYHAGFATAFAGFSDLDIQVVQQVADSEKVVTHMATRLTHTGLFNGIPATGKTAILNSIRIDRVEHGKIAEHWSVGDLAGLQQQLQNDRSAVVDPGGQSQRT